MIRQATAKDLRGLIELGEAFRRESRIYYPPIEEQEVLSWLSQTGNIVTFLKESDGLPVGFLSGMLTSYPFTSREMASVVLLYVAPEFRGKMIGPALLRAFSEWAEGKVFQERVTLHSGIDAERTGQFLEKLGFRVTGKQYVRQING